MIITSIVDPWNLEIDDCGNLVTDQDVGGMFSTLEPATQYTNIGWVSTYREREIPDNQYDQGAATLSPPTETKHRLEIARLGLDDLDVSTYFDYVDRMLWPLFHGMTERILDVDTRDLYQHVNQEFGQVATDLAEKMGTNTYWIHDFQLMRLPKIIRERDSDASIGYFHHIPMPPKSLFGEFDAPYFIRGLVASDIIGVQTPTDAKRLFALAKSCGFTVDDAKACIRTGDGSTNVVIHPVGVDKSRFPDKYQIPGLPISSRSVDTLVLGVDRMDYTKNIPSKLIGFGRFLRDIDNNEKVVMYQSISVDKAIRYPEYRYDYEAAKQIASKINAQFGGPKYKPVILEKRKLTETELATLYAKADVGLVTPIADGMNLVAKEFVYAQQTLAESPGVLVLSETVGAKEELDGSVFVKPAPRNIAAGLLNAVDMSDRERLSRIDKMHNSVINRDNQWWIRQQLAGLNQAIDYTSYEH